MSVCVCMCVCIHIYMYIYIYVCVCVCVRVCVASIHLDAEYSKFMQVVVFCSALLTNFEHLFITILNGNYNFAIAYVDVKISRLSLN